MAVKPIRRKLKEGVTYSLPADQISDLLGMYLQWEGIIGYTYDILHLWFESDFNAYTLDEFLKDEGIIGYTDDIVGILEDGEAYFRGADEEDLAKLKKQFGVRESMRKSGKRRLKENESKKLCEGDTFDYYGNEIEDEFFEVQDEDGDQIHLFSTEEEATEYAEQDEDACYIVRYEKYYDDSGDESDFEPVGTVWTNESFRKPRGKRLTEGKLVDPEPEDIEFFENYLTNTLGYEIEAKGKTWFGNNHYQIRSINKGNTREDLKLFVRDLNQLDELMEKREIPMTYNAGLDDNGYITAGLDLNKKYIPDETDVPLEQSHRYTKLFVDNTNESLKESITWDDLRSHNFVYEIEGLGDDWKYIEFFEGSNDIYDDDIPDGEDPEDYSLVYYTIYNSNKEEVDGGEMISKLDQSFEEDELIKDLLELSGLVDRSLPTFKRLSDNFLDESFIKESRQLNEGPGAGYTISGKVGGVEINNLTIKDTQEDGNYIYYTIDCDIDLDLDDVVCESAYYGGTISETPVKVEYMKLSAGKEWDLPAPTDDSVFDLLMGLKIEALYGGGWGHSTFSGSLDLDDRNLTYSSWSYEIDELEVKFTDPGAVDAIDKYATGDNYTPGYRTDDGEYFETKEEAIEYAEENDCDFVEEVHDFWSYDGENYDYEDIDLVGKVWVNPKTEGAYDGEVL